jgi:hypothetical protein
MVIAERLARPTCFSWQTTHLNRDEVLWVINHCLPCAEPIQSSAHNIALCTLLGETTPANLNSFNVNQSFSHVCWNRGKEALVEISGTSRASVRLRGHRKIVRLTRSDSESLQYCSVSNDLLPTSTIIMQPLFFWIVSLTFFPPCPGALHPKVHCLHSRSDRR